MSINPPIDVPPTTIIGPPPSSVDYDNDSVVIHVVLGELGYVAQQVAKRGKEIGDCLNKIMKAQTALKLSWFGGSSAEATSFNDEWMKCMYQLFGSPGNPSGGVLDQYAMALEKAYGNYDATELQLTDMFLKIRDALAGKSQSSGGPAQPGQDDPILITAAGNSFQAWQG